VWAGFACPGISTGPDQDKLTATRNASSSHSPSGLIVRIVTSIPPHQFVLGSPCMYRLPSSHTPAPAGGRCPCS
jgi:hypothetical protein